MRPLTPDDLMAELYEFEGDTTVIQALRSIALVSGNLPDDALTSRTGPNDAVARGFMVVTARALALRTLETMRTTQRP